MAERAEGGSGGVGERKGEELLLESDILTVMVVEVCRGWMPLQGGAYFLAETGISCWHCHFLSLVYSLYNTVSHLLF